VILKSQSGRTLEADFAMLWQRDGPGVQLPQLILGECKTFGHFEEKDVRRMRIFAKEFPGAYLVFANLSDGLTPEDVALISPFAVWGRKKWRNPVIVLTARELANDWNPPICWKRAEEARVAKECQPLKTLTALADATQQIRLGLPAGEGWPHAQWWQREIDAQQGD